VSPGRARTVYRVAVDAATGAVDAAETARLRADGPHREQAGAEGASA